MKNLDDNVIKLFCDICESLLGENTFQVFKNPRARCKDCHDKLEKKAKEVKLICMD